MSVSSPVGGEKWQHHPRCSSNHFDHGECILTPESQVGGNTLREDERKALSEVIYATWPEDQYERLKFLERVVEEIIVNRATPDDCPTCGAKPDPVLGHVTCTCSQTVIDPPIPPWCFEHQAYNCPHTRGERPVGPNQHTRGQCICGKTHTMEDFL